MPAATAFGRSIRRAFREGVDDAKVRQFLLEKYSMEIAGGFGPLAGKVFRIGTMGYSSTAENVQLILEALGDAIHHA